MHVLDRYVHKAPDPQLAVDIFAGSWACALPAPYEDITAGTIPLFHDPRVEWAATTFGGFAGKQVLELGPLEGAQTYLLEQHGAEHIYAIESNTTAYLKCLIVKELLKLRRVEFVCGDFMEYFRGSTQHFDVCFASGVLYHMRRPLELLARAAASADQLFIWTHYYDRSLYERPDLAQHHGVSGRAQYAGMAHTLHRQEYQDSLQWDGFCGGSAPFSYWLARDDLLDSLRHFGFDQLTIGFETSIEHSGGPSIAIAAVRSDPTTRPDPATFGEYRIAPELLVLEQEPRNDRTTEPPNHRTTEPRTQNPEPRTENPEPSTENSELRAGGRALELSYAVAPELETATYVKYLEAEILRKNEHIRHVERTLERYEAGAMMRLLRLLRRA
ncbi:DUF1698 domain-containing protein [Candidatus Gracilibacteria bacterium]|nr:DUF1698 domain-containing protein [Candidatus Gracilibacteria bacterium]